jgi:DNA-binding transcriptional MerR regulator
MVDKAPDAFRTISEVADDLDLPQHVLRFWETRFGQIKPLKRGGGRRYYRPDDVDLLRGIRHLLYGEGYTIKGVQRILKEDGIRVVQGVGRGETPSLPAPRRDDEPDGDDRPDWTDGVEAGAAPGQAASAGAALSPSDIARLEAALADLEECARVLATLKASDSGTG